MGACDHRPGRRAAPAVCIVHLNIDAANYSKSATINSRCGIAQRQRTGIRLRPLIHEAINNKESA
ncbi:hypothetical protein CFB52_028500 [Burkholderia sp. AU18528]|nr:hypothetical protein CFB52_028500 [Burkholderia sp. AU18528]RQX81479.1 hypothetical protein DF034_19195 [Burkholderia anthina]